MELGDLIPWLWCLGAGAAAWRARRGRRGSWPTCIVALVLASVHLFGWNKPIYHAGREVLIGFGVYDDRSVFKVAIGLAFFPLVAWAGFRAWRWSRRVAPLLRTALVLMTLDALYVAVRTLSIDGWMPLAIGLEPGKSILGISLAALATVAIAAAGPDPEFFDVDA